MQKLSIIIPVYESSKVIEALVKQLVEKLESTLEVEVVLINDASPTDDSALVCSDLALNDSRIVFIDLSKNFGEHNAVMAGLNHCTGEVAVIMDDDFQNPPSEVLKLVNKLDEGFDVVYSSFEKKEHSFVRNLGSSFNNAVANRLIKKPRELYLSSFKAINRFLIDEIVKYSGPYPYIDGLIFQTTKNCAQVNVRHEKRESGESGYTLGKLVSLWLNMFTNFSILPLRIATITGFLLASISIVIALFFVVEKLINPDLPVGWASVIVSIFFIGSVQLFALGMVGEYLGRLFLKNNGMPQYVVRSLIKDKKKSI